MINEEAKKLLLGLLGEKIVARWLRWKGWEVKESLNIFDTLKDLEIMREGSKRCMIEVKTQVAFLKYNSFTIRKNQLKKIKNSERVYWVAVPPTEMYDTYSGCIFEMNPNEVEYKEMKVNGTDMILFNRKQKGIKVVHKITNNNVLQQLNELSTSNV